MLSSPSHELEPHHCGAPGRAATKGDQHRGRPRAHPAVPQRFVKRNRVGTLLDGLNLLNVQANYQPMAEGIVVILSVFLSRFQ